MNEKKKAVRWLKRIVAPETLEKMTGTPRIYLGAPNTLLNTNNNTHRIIKIGELKIDKYHGLVECINNSYLPIHSLNFNTQNLGCELPPPNTETVIPQEKFLTKIITYGLTSDSLKKYYKYISNGAN